MRRSSISKIHSPRDSGCLSKWAVDALKVDRDTLLWDSELARFGVRVHPT